MNDQLIEEIKRRVSLTSLTGGRVKGYVACPDPSCQSHLKDKLKCQLQSDAHYKCYVCDAHGDIFNWVMVTRECSFAAAFTNLAARSGIALKPNVERSELLHKVVLTAHRWLMQHPEKIAYLTKSKGITKGQILRYQLGYLDAEGLILRAAGLSVEELLQLWLLYKNPEGPRPYKQALGGRYLFPIRDRKGRLVQVKGRIDPDLEWPDDVAKLKALAMKPESAPDTWGQASHLDYLYLEENLHVARDDGYGCLWEGETDTLTGTRLDLPSYGLQTCRQLYRHAHKLQDAHTWYVGLDNDDATEKTLVQELLQFQLTMPGKRIMRLQFPHCAGIDIRTGLPVKVDLTDYVVKFGKTRADVEKLMAAALPCHALIIDKLGAQYEEDRVQNDLKRLFRATPAEYKSDFIARLSKATGYPENLLVFALDPSSMKAAARHA